MPKVWESADDSVHKNSITVPAGVLIAGTTYEVRARHTGTASGDGSYGTKTITTLSSFGTTNTPTVTVTGEPSSVTDTPTITTSAFAVSSGTDTLASTDWQVYEGATLVWESLANTVNTLSINMPAGILAENTSYEFKARHNGTVTGASAYGSKTATTLSSFIGSMSICGTGARPFPAMTEDGFFPLLCKLTDTTFIAAAQTAHSGVVYFTKGIISGDVISYGNVITPFSNPSYWGSSRKSIIRLSNESVLVGFIDKVSSSGYGKVGIINTSGLTDLSTDFVKTTVSFNTSTSNLRLVTISDLVVLAIYKQSEDFKAKYIYLNADKKSISSLGVERSLTGITGSSVVANKIGRNKILLEYTDNGHGEARVITTKTDDTVTMSSEVLIGSYTSYMGATRISNYRYDSVGNSTGTLDYAPHYNKFNPLNNTVTESTVATNHTRSSRPLYQFSEKSNEYFGGRLGINTTNLKGVVITMKDRAAYLGNVSSTSSNVVTYSSALVMDASTIVFGYVESDTNRGQLQKYCLNVAKELIAVPDVYISSSDYDNCEESFTITTDPYRSNNSIAHSSTDWYVYNATTNAVVWSSLNNTTDKVAIAFPAGILQVSTDYRIEATHKSATAEALSGIEYIKTKASFQ